MFGTCLIRGDHRVNWSYDKEIALLYLLFCVHLAHFFALFTAAAEAILVVIDQPGKLSQHVQTLSNLGFVELLLVPGKS